MSNIVLAPCHIDCFGMKPSSTLTANIKSHLLWTEHTINLFEKTILYSDPEPLHMSRGSVIFSQS